MSIMLQNPTAESWPTACSTAGSAAPDARPRPRAPHAPRDPEDEHPRPQQQDGAGKQRGLRTYLHGCDDGRSCADRLLETPLQFDLKNLGIAELETRLGTRGHDASSD